MHILSGVDKAILGCAGCHFDDGDLILAPHPFTLLHVLDKRLKAVVWEYDRWDALKSSRDLGDVNWMRDLEEEYAVTQTDASSDIGSLPEDDTLVRTEGGG